MKQKVKHIIRLLCIVFIIHSILIVGDGLIDEEGYSDIVVILGNKVHEDGSLSLRLKSRMDKGLELYQNQKCQYLVVSGGLGKEGHWEGNVMADYLIQQGVPQKAIIIDNDGNNTAATAQNVRALQLPFQSITVVSQYYHISRSKLAFQKVGFAEVKGVHADYFELRDFYSIFREFFGYYKYWLTTL
ncbi:YdcF family protein [Aureispira anguillae]|uniref:YdcF family protein n=1 Tax=Aureispira anguillae TaxID=2864201 RepID=A0A915YGE8_9BACT|nr:YdcF family protein [Aureispira anguillae]BDS12544.1 YdcF family protein [Aureispira anguillae]